MDYVPEPATQWTARCEIARSMALLPVVGRGGREACLGRISSVCESHAGGDLDPPLHRSGVVAAAAYLSRAAHGLSEARRLFDILVRRAGAPHRGSDGAGDGASLLRDELAKSLSRDRALQIELACEKGSSSGRSFMEAVMAGGRPGRHDSGEHPDILIRKLLHADDMGTTLRYTASEVDAVFFQANEVDTEVVHSLVRPSPPAKGVDDAAGAVRLADEDFYINAVRPSIATLIADAAAADPTAADRIATQPGGLRALRLLAESVAPSDVVTDLFETEIARSIGNVSAGALDAAAAATKAADEGLVSLLSRWASDDMRHISRGHLQVESLRALSNLSQPLQPDSSSRFVYGNGVLPLQAPGDDRFAIGSAASWDTDVVFVHGLRGGPLMTWRCGRVSIDENGQVRPADERPAVLRGSPLAGKNPAVGPNSGDLPPTLASQESETKAMAVWPRDWLHEDAPNCRVLSIGHDAGVLREGVGRGKIGPTLASRAAEISSALERSGVGRNGRKIVFITHSYGGLLVKQALLMNSSLLRQTRGVVFFGVPHFGSPVAGSWSGQTEFVLSQAVRELFPAASARAALEALNVAFVDAINDEKAAGHRVQVVSFGEGKKLKLEVGARRGQASVLLDLVPRESADPLTGQFWLLHDADHVQLSKPPRRDDFRYRIVAAIARVDRDRH